MRAMITAMTTTASTPKARTSSEPKPKHPRQAERKTQLPDADCDDVSSFPHENSRNKNYDNHNFFPLANAAPPLDAERRTKDPPQGSPAWTLDTRLASSFSAVWPLLYFYEVFAYKSMFLDMQKSRKRYKRFMALASPSREFV